MTKRSATVQDAHTGASGSVGRRLLLNPLFPACIAGLLWIGCASDSGDGSPKAGTGAGGAGNTPVSICDAPTATNPDDLISDFNDGTGSVNQNAPNRGGGFYTFNDGKGTQVPAAGGSSAPDATATTCGEKNPYVLCTSGSGFTTWGAGLATDVGVVGTDSVKKPYDAIAAGYTGISFWGKSNQGTYSVNVKFPNKETAFEGGLCDKAVAAGATACYDDFAKAVSFGPEWTLYTIKFSELLQAGWGRPAPTSSFDATTMYAIQYQVTQTVTEFNFCIDNLMFVR